MASYNVHVSNIAPDTTQKSLEDFFTFCGKISSIEFNESATPKSAVIHFEKATAVKTALMLNGGTLDNAHLAVSSEADHPDEPHDSHTEGAPLEQTDKPRAAIVAEYLAKGYVLSDGILQRAIELDQKQGISAKFLAYWNTFDHTVGSKIAPKGTDPSVATLSGTVTGHVNTATERAKSVDEQKGISAKANEYYSKALSSPLGQKVRAFYTTTSKQVLDIHEEAKRIASSNPTPAPTGPAETSSAPAVPSDLTVPAAAPAVTEKPPTTTAPTVV